MDQRHYQHPTGGPSHGNTGNEMGNEYHLGGWYNENSASLPVGQAVPYQPTYQALPSAGSMTDSMRMEFYRIRIRLIDMQSYLQTLQEGDVELKAMVKGLLKPKQVLDIATEFKTLRVAVDDICSIVDELKDVISDNKDLRQDVNNINKNTQDIMASLKTIKQDVQSLREGAEINSQFQQQPNGYLVPVNEMAQGFEVLNPPPYNQYYMPPSG